MNKKCRGRKNGFTLVELLAVIVILAIILVIAVPKVMSIIEDAKKGTLESTAKMIASGAEKQKIQNTVLGKTEEITCDSVAKINKGDYASCDITFEDNTAKVTITGSGKFEGLWVCKGTKTTAIAQKEECSSPLQVKHPLFLKGQELSYDDFEVTLTHDDGSTRKLWNGGLKADDSKVITVSSPNWPNSYPENSTDEIEKTFEGAVSLEITFDPASSFNEDISGNSSLLVYDNSGNELYELSYISFAGKTYVIPGNYVKIKIITESFGVKGFSATIKPMYNIEPEYTISPSVAPTTGDKFDIMITVKEQNISKKITTKLVYNLDEYVEYLLPFTEELENPKETYEGTTYDTGIRYVGNSPKNKVYYNCDDVDANGVLYGNDNYNYPSSCEVWRIVGVFDTKTNTSGEAVPRVKLINTESTFEASWDSTVGTSRYEILTDGPVCTGINCGYGINQWGPSGDYEGADLMQLLNGYYISKDGSTCTYCNGNNQGVCEQTCTADSLKNENMKVLTNNAKNMVENAVWYTYAIDNYSTMYLQERGIINQILGNKFCPSSILTSLCRGDIVERTTSWTGLVGLIYESDAWYANGWLDGWSITPSAYEFTEGSGTAVLDSGIGSGGYSIMSNLVGTHASDSLAIHPSVYLKTGIKVIRGNGDDKPYILSLQ